MGGTVHTKKSAYIIGAGSFARELESWMKMDNKFNEEYKLKGFLYDGQEKKNVIKSDLKIVGNWKDFPFDKNDACFIGVGDVLWRKNFLLNWKKE